MKINQNNSNKSKSVNKALKRNNVAWLNEYLHKFSSLIVVRLFYWYNKQIISSQGLNLIINSFFTAYQWSLIWWICMISPYRFLNYLIDSPYIYDIYPSKTNPLVRSKAVIWLPVTHTPSLFIFSSIKLGVFLLILWNLHISSISIPNKLDFKSTFPAIFVNYYHELILRMLLNWSCKLSFTCF